MPSNDRSQLLSSVWPEAPSQALEEDMLISGRQLRTIIPVSEMTIWRWHANPKYAHIGFPKPKRVNGRLFWKLEEIRAWWARREAA